MPIAYEYRPGARRSVRRFDEVTMTAVGAVLDADAIERCEARAAELGASFRIR